MDRPRRYPPRYPSSSSETPNNNGDNDVGISTTPRSVDGTVDNESASKTNNNNGANNDVGTSTTPPTFLDHTDDNVGASKTNNNNDGNVDVGIGTTPRSVDPTADNENASSTNNNNGGNNDVGTTPPPPSLPQLFPLLLLRSGVDDKDSSFNEDCSNKNFDASNKVGDNSDALLKGKSLSGTDINNDDSFVLLKGKSLSGTDISQKFRLRACSETGDSETRVRANKEEPEPRQGQGQGVPRDNANSQDGYDGNGPQPQSQQQQPPMFQTTKQLLGLPPNEETNMPIADVLQDVDDSYGLSQGGARMNTEEANIHDEDAKRPATMLRGGANESCSNNGKTDNDDVVCSVEIIADENGLTDIASIDLMEDVTIDLTQNTADSTEAITRAYDVCEEDDDVSSESSESLCDYAGDNKGKIDSSSSWYKFYWKIVHSLQELFTLHDVPPEGNCGYYAFINAMLHFFSEHPEEREARADLPVDILENSYKGVMMLRADLYSFIDEIASLLMSIELCPIVSFNDDLWVSNYALKNGGSTLVKRVQAMVWDKEYFEKHTPGRMVASRLWFDTEKVAPLLALRWRVTTMVYAKYFPSNNDCTSIAFYRPHDGKVSTSPFHNQIICPTNDAVVMYYNGRSHYNYCKRRADAPHSSICHVLDSSSSDDGLLVGNGVLPDSRDLSNTMSTNDYNPEESKKPSNSGIVVPNQANSDVELTTEACPSNKKSRKIDVADMKDYTATDNHQTPPRKKKNSLIVLHHDTVTSPLKRKLLHEKQRQTSEFYIAESFDIVENKTYIHWKNEKEYTTSMTASDFDKLVDVVLTPKCTVTKFKAAWKKHDGQFVVSDILLQYLKELPMYKNHYDLRFNNNHVTSKYSIKNVNEESIGNCNHEKYNTGRCITKNRASRAKTECCIYKDGECIHRKDKIGKCESTAYIGFRSVDILEHIVSKTPTITLYFEVNGNCYHEKNADLSRLQGNERADLRKQHMLDASGQFADAKPSHVYKHHNRVINPDGDGKIKNIRQAYSTKLEISKQYKEYLGLTSKNQSFNFFKSAEDVRSSDLAFRVGHQANYVLTNGNVDNLHLGVLRDYRVSYQAAYDRGTTPLQVILWSAPSVILFNSAAKGGRLIAHFDGTKSDVNWGIQVKKDDCIQRWDLHMSGSFMVANDTDENKIVRKNLNPYKLMQYHSPLTSAKDLSYALSSFFDAQHELCSTYERPLMVLTDCAPQLMTAILTALKFANKKPVTRLEYNNVLLIFVLHCETTDWSKKETSNAINLLLTFVPTLLHWCRSHSTRAVYQWVESTLRTTEFRLHKRYFHRLLMDLIRHSTATFELTETYVHFALAIYVTRVPFFRVRRLDAMTVQSSPIKSDMKDIGACVQSFISKQRTKIRQDFAEHYKKLSTDKTIETVNSTMHVSSVIVEGIIRDAFSEDLQVASTYCVDNTGRTMNLSTSICYGSMCNLADSGDDYCEVEERVVKPRFMHSLLTTTDFSDITSSNEEFILVSNPLKQVAISNYLRKVYINNIPSLHIGPCKLARIGRDATADNSNQSSEGCFKASKYDSDYKLHCKDAALYLRYYAKEDRRATFQFVHQLKLLNQLVERTNVRTMKRDIQMSTVEQQEISIDENEVQFAKKLDKYTDLLNRLLDVLRQQGMETPKEQHDHLSEFASKEMNEDSSFLHMKTWKKWISGSSKSEKRKNHPAWNVVEEFLSRFEKDDDKNDNATGIEMTELGHELPDIGCDNIPSTNTTPMKVDDSGDAVMASNENNITVGDVLRVMSNDPPSLVSVTFIDTVQKYRESWSLLVNPENTFIPKRVLHTIDKFCKKCLSDSKFADLWTCETDYIYKACQLRNVELAGVPAYSGSKACLFVDGRKFVEKNIPTSEPCWFNRSSVALEVGTVDDIFARVFAKVPKELIPEKGETKATMIDKIAGSYWLDVIFNKFNNISGSLNEWEGSMQPVRRTLGVVKRRAHIYRSDLAPGEEEGDGRHVISLYCYPNTECPTNKWMCRPLTNMDYAQMITVWAYMWSYGTEETRKSPPNGIQQLMYHKVLNKKMGFHRDNFKNNVMTNLENGTVPWGDHPTVGGSGNSQIHGTSVIVFTRGNCPMKMIFKYPSLNGSATQEKKWYVTSPSFQMKMDDGWITVLDPVDDMLMLHSVEFEEDDGNEEHFRIAWVYRYLKVVHDFYVDSCTIRRDKQMMNTVERKDDWDSAKMQRDIFM